MTDEVTPIGFGGKMFDLNKLSDDQKQTIARFQTLEVAVEQMGQLAMMIANLNNLSNLAAEGLRMNMARAAETFPNPINLPETGATSSSSEGGVPSAPTDENVPTGGDGVAPPESQEGDLH